MKAGKGGKGKTKSIIVRGTFVFTSTIWGLGYVCPAGWYYSSTENNTNKTLTWTQ